MVLRLVFNEICRIGTAKITSGVPMILDAPTLEDCLEVGWWRKKCREALRTPGIGSGTQQQRFFEHITSPQCRDRYYALRDNTNLIAFGGFAPVDSINRTGEIRLLLIRRNVATASAMGHSACYAMRDLTGSICIPSSENAIFVTPVLAFGAP